MLRYVFSLKIIHNSYEKHLKISVKIYVFCPKILFIIGDPMVNNNNSFIQVTRLEIVSRHGLS
jgi:hypothetical protein